MTFQELKRVCPSELEESLDFPHPFVTCFEHKWIPYIEKVSLTGLSLGLKLSFDFLDQTKRSWLEQIGEKGQNEIQVIIALYYLYFNNLILTYGHKNFYGHQFTYPGYIAKLENFMNEANEFSQNIIIGLNSKEGIASLPDFKKEYYLSILLQESSKLDLEINKTKNFIDQEIQRLTDN
jgi:hypothetical protein